MGSRLRGAAAAIALGAAPADALAALGKGDDVRLLAGAVVLQGRSGGDLSALLDGMANLLLERRDARRAAEVATAQARATARMVIALPGAGLLALLLLDRPALAALLASPIGWLSLLGSAGLCVLGRSLIGRLERCGRDRARRAAGGRCPRVLAAARDRPARCGAPRPASRRSPGSAPLARPRRPGAAGESARPAGRLTARVRGLRRGRPRADGRHRRVVASRCLPGSAGVYPECGPGRPPAACEAMERRAPARST